MSAPGHAEVCWCPKCTPPRSGLPADFQLLYAFVESLGVAPFEVVSMNATADGVAVELLARDADGQPVLMGDSFVTYWRTWKRL